MPEHRHRHQYRPLPTDRTPPAHHARNPRGSGGVRHPVSITTKSALVVRDIDLLAPMAAQGLVSVTVSVTTLDRDLAGRLEPRAAVPAKRLGAIAALTQAGIPTAVMVAPVIPALTDHEMESILTAAAANGAQTAGWMLLRLPLEVKDLFEAWLTSHAPDRRNHVLSSDPPKPQRQAQRPPLFPSIYR